MRPGWIEVHVHRQRTPEPDTQTGEESPLLRNIAPRERKRNHYCEKTVQRGPESHRHDIRARKAIGRDMAAEAVAKKYACVRRDQQWRPQDGRPDGKVVIDVARDGV